MIFFFFPKCKYSHVLEDDTLYCLETDSYCTFLLQKEDGSVVMVFVLSVASLDLIPHTTTDFVYDFRRIILTQFLNGA